MGSVGYLDPLSCGSGSGMDVVSGNIGPNKRNCPDIRVITDEVHSILDGDKMVMVMVITLAMEIMMGGGCL